MDNRMYPALVGLMSSPPIEWIARALRRALAVLQRHRQPLREGAQLRLLHLVHALHHGRQPLQRLLLVLRQHSVHLLVLLRVVGHGRLCCIALRFYCNNKQGKHICQGFFVFILHFLVDG